MAQMPYHPGVAISLLSRWQEVSEPCYRVLLSHARRPRRPPLPPARHRGGWTPYLRHRVLVRAANPWEGGLVFQAVRLKPYAYARWRAPRPRPIALAPSGLLAGWGLPNCTHCTASALGGGDPPTPTLAGGPGTARPSARPTGPGQRLPRLGGASPSPTAAASQTSASTASSRPFSRCAARMSAIASSRTSAPWGRCRPWPSACRSPR